MDTPNRHSDQSSPLVPIPSKSALRPSAISRPRSLSPRKKNANQPLHIRMNLTETQMDKITDAFTNNSPSTSIKSRHKTPNKSHSEKKIPNTDYANYDVTSPTLSELMPIHRDNVVSPSLAERRHKSPPSLKVSSVNSKSTSAKPARVRIESVSDLGSPLKPIQQPKYGRHPLRSSSKYSYDEEAPAPLQISQNKFNCPSPKLNKATFDAGNHWAQLHGCGISPEPSPLQQNTTHRPRRTKSNTDAFRHQSHVAEVYDAAIPCKSMLQALPVESPMFSPLAFYFRGQDLPVEKRGEKKLFGDNGWLEKTGEQAERESKTPQKKGKLFDSIKKIARDMTELHYPSRRSMTLKPSYASQIPISLDVREQSLLYCELEYHLTGALNNYIAAELEKGHLLPDNFKKIADAWHQQGRPRVVGFRFDLETQIDLVALHINDFTFYGRRQGNPSEISGLLHAMKMNSRAMRIRTFCQPDSVIAKQLVDSQALFDMISVPKASQVALAEIVQFFKVIVEREQDYQVQRQRYDEEFARQSGQMSPSRSSYIGRGA